VCLFVTSLRKTLPPLSTAVGLGSLSSWILTK